MFKHFTEIEEKLQKIVTPKQYTHSQEQEICFSVKGPSSETESRNQKSGPTNQQ